MDAVDTNTGYALSIRDWIIRDLTDPEEVAEALAYQPRKSLVRNRLEQLAVGSVIAVVDVPLAKIRPVVYQLNAKNGGHWTTVPKSTHFPHVRVRRDK
jgi:hypothetical protein